jgi:glycosyltransferase involved in cell wall biosynthesis
MNLQRKIKNAVRTWRSRGSQGLINLLEAKFRALKENRKYQKWVREFDALTDEDRRKIRRRIEDFSHKPLISVILPVYNIEEKWLRLCVESVRKQLYANWQLCIADDSSPSPRVREILEEYAARDERIKVVFREKNGHISAASNSALELASGEFSVLLDHDDELAEHALYFVAEELNRFPETAMIYSDEDLIDSRNRRHEPKFKPDWSQDFIYSLNLITHLSAYRTEILRQIGGFRIGAEGSQDYDLALRFTERISANQIRHIPKILYHWRAIEGSVALSGDEKPYAHERARDAIRAHLERAGKKAKVSRTFHNLHRVSYDLPDDLPRASLITTRDANNLQRISSKTDYGNLELLSETISGESIAADFNQLTKKSSGEILVFLDGDFEPQNFGWLRELAGFAMQKEIGAVGAKIFGPDEKIRHAGIVLGVNNLIGFAHRGLPKDEAGYFQRAQIINNFSAVSGVVAMRREVFELLEGFDAENFPNGLFDVDFCLRLRREKNLRVAFTPYVELLQTSDSSTESVLNRKETLETENFRTRWKDLIENDPFYNPNLSRENERFEISEK